jgi:nucleoside-diphosphate-sugar epimerase
MNQDMCVTIARPFNIVGAGLPKSLLVGAVLERVRDVLAREGEPVVAIGNLDTKRDFIAVEDAVDAYVRMLQADYRGEIFNICSGELRSVRSVVEQLLSFSPRPIRFRIEPALLRPTDVPVMYGNSSKACRMLGFRPTISLDAALRAAWDSCFDKGD